MKKYFIFLFALLLSMGLVTVSCKKEKVSGDNSTSYSGYAPTLDATSGKTFQGLSNHVNFSYDGSSWNVTAKYSTLYPNFQLTSKSVSYAKNSDNGATFTYNVSFTYRSSYSGETMSYSTSGSLSLYFISPSEGYASGTRDNMTISNEVFTLL